VRLQPPLNLDVSAGLVDDDRHGLARSQTVKVENTQTVVQFDLVLILKRNAGDISH
jgi:hypothetical protein